MTFFNFFDQIMSWKLNRQELSHEHKSLDAKTSPNNSGVSNNFVSKIYKLRKGNIENKYDDDDYYYLSPTCVNGVCTFDVLAEVKNLIGEEEYNKCLDNQKLSPLFLIAFQKVILAILESSNVL